MPERVSIADGDELAFRAKLLWLLTRQRGGEVLISDRELASVPDEPELIFARADGAVRLVARLVSPVREPASPLAAELDGPELPGRLPLPGTEPAT